MIAADFLHFRYRQAIEASGKMAAMMATPSAVGGISVAAPRRRFMRHLSGIIADDIKPGVASAPARLLADDCHDRLIEVIMTIAAGRRWRHESRRWPADAASAFLAVMMLVVSSSVADWRGKAKCRPVVMKRRAPDEPLLKALEAPSTFRLGLMNDDRPPRDACMWAPPDCSGHARRAASPPRRLATAPELCRDEV